MTLLTGQLDMEPLLTEVTDLASSASWPGFADVTRCASAVSIPGSRVDALRRAAEVVGRKEQHVMLRSLCLDIEAMMYRPFFSIFDCKANDRDTMIDRQ